MNKRYFIYNDYKSCTSNISTLQSERNFSLFEYIRKNTFEFTNCSGLKTEKIIDDFVQDKLKTGYIELTESNLKENNYLVDDTFGLVLIDDGSLIFTRFIDVFDSEVKFFIDLEDEQIQDYKIKEHQKNLYFELLGKQREIKALLQKELFIYYKEKEYEGWVRESRRIKEEKEIWNIISIAPDITLKEEGEIMFSWETNWTGDYGVAVKLIDWKLDMVDFILNVVM